MNQRRNDGAVPPIFVISPSELAERRLVVSAHLAEMGLETTMFSGLMGPKMRLSSEREKPGATYSALPSSVICLAINHWALWQHIHLSGLESAIIMEDDIILPDDFREKFSQNMANTPNDWDMIYMGILYPGRMKDGRIRVQRLNGNVWCHIRMQTWDGACDGLFAYMLSRSGARKILESGFKLDEPVDRWVSMTVSPFLRTYIWHPSPVGLRKIKSSITGRNVGAKKSPVAQGAIQGDRQ